MSRLHLISTLFRWITVVVASCAGMWLLWLSDMPLGVPTEWVWDRAAGRVAWTDLLLEWVQPFLLGSLLLIFAWCGSTRIEHCRRWQAALWLAALAGGSGVWWLSVQDASLGTAQLAKVPMVMYYKGPSGYFFVARYEIQSTRGFLSSYEARLAQGDVLHEGTHPPGLYLFHRAALRICRENPQLAHILKVWQPESVRTSFDAIEQFAVGTGRPLSPTDRAAIWLASLVTLWIAAVVVFPLYGLLREEIAASTAWKAACFWPFVPAVAVFFPKSDLLYPLPAMAFLALWISAWRRGCPWRAGLSGLVLFVGMLCSLAFLPVVLLAVLFSLWEWIIPQHAQLSRRRRFGSIGLSITGFLLPLIGLGLWGHINLFNAWWLNLQNHAAFYGEYPRTYAYWLAITPVELALAAGIPLACLAAWSVGTQAVSWKSSTTAMSRLTWCIVLVWALLWLSGKNMGETGRLWIVFMPWLICLAAPLFRCGPQNATLRQTSSRGWLGLLALQALVCLLTVNAVDGFQLESTSQLQQQLQRERAGRAESATSAGSITNPN